MSVEGEEYRAQLERAKLASSAQLLFRCARLLNEQALKVVQHRTGFHGLRAAHTALFPHIDLEGTRLTELAKRLGISKQAVGQIVDELQTIGTLERVPDPSDRRAKLIRFSRSGREGLMNGLSILREIESELARELGVEDMESLHRILVRLVPLLETTDCFANLYPSPNIDPSQESS